MNGKTDTHTQKIQFLMIETLKCLNKLSPGIIITKIPYD